MPQDIVAVPKTIALTVGGTATANIVAVMPALYSNTALTNGGTLTFAWNSTNATVGAQTGVITGVLAGTSIITATYHDTWNNFYLSINVTVA